METVAILFLEMHKPVANVLAQGAIAFSPFFLPIFGADKFDKISQVLSKRGNVEKLIRRIEELRDEGVREEQARC
jgi:hypothetical protein